MERHCIKKFHIPRCSGWLWMRVALLQISCVCHHMAPMAKGRPAGPVTDPPNNGLDCSSNVYSFVQFYYLPALSTAMPLPTTICSPVLSDSYLLPFSNALLVLRTQYRNGEKKQFYHDFLSISYLLLSSISFS